MFESTNYFNRNFSNVEPENKGFHNKFYRGQSKDFKSKQDLE